MVVLLFSNSAKQVLDEALTLGWNKFQAKCFKMFKPLGREEQTPLFYCLVDPALMMLSLPSKIFLTTISNGTTMESIEVNALEWVKA